jgi:chaperonin GroES
MMYILRHFAFCFSLSLLLVEITAFRLPSYNLVKSNKPFLSVRHVPLLSAKNKLDGIEFDGELKPVFNNVLVKVRQLSDTTVSGIYLPETTKKRPSDGIVEAIGTGKVDYDTGVTLKMDDIHVGSSVIYGKYDGVEMKLNDQMFQMIKDEDILMIYNGNQPSLENSNCFRDHLLIQLAKKEEKTESGIFLAGEKEKRSSTGKVVKVGPGKQSSNGNIVIPIPVKEGEHIKFREYSGINIKFGNQEYIILSSSDILAKW